MPRDPSCRRRRRTCRHRYSAARPARRALRARARRPQHVRPPRARVQPRRQAAYLGKATPCVGRDRRAGASSAIFFRRVRGGGARLARGPQSPGRRGSGEITRSLRVFAPCGRAWRDVDGSRGYEPGSFAARPPRRRTAVASGVREVDKRSPSRASASASPAARPGRGAGRPHLRVLVREIVPRAVEPHLSRSNDPPSELPRRAEEPAAHGRSGCSKPGLTSSRPRCERTPVIVIPRTFHRGGGNSPFTYRLLAREPRRSAHSSSSPSRAQGSTISSRASVAVASAKPQAPRAEREDRAPCSSAKRWRGQ